MDSTTRKVFEAIIQRSLTRLILPAGVEVLDDEELIGLVGTALAIAEIGVRFNAEPETVEVLRSYIETHAESWGIPGTLAKQLTPTLLLEVVSILGHLRLTASDMMKEVRSDS